jgi:hypothetical protein
VDPSSGGLLLSQLFGDAFGLACALQSQLGLLLLQRVSSPASKWFVMRAGNPGSAADLRQRAELERAGYAVVGRDGLPEARMARAPAPRDEEPRGPSPPSRFGAAHGDRGAQIRGAAAWEGAAGAGGVRSLHLVNVRATRTLVDAALVGRAACYHDSTRNQAASRYPAHRHRPSRWQSVHDLSPTQPTAMPHATHATDAAHTQVRGPRCQVILEAVCARFGPVESVAVFPRRGYAFVNMREAEDAAAVYHALDSKVRQLHAQAGRPAWLLPATSPPPLP